MIEKRLRDKIGDLIARAAGIANASFDERTEQWKADGEAWRPTPSNLPCPTFSMPIAGGLDWRRRTAQYLSVCH
jgi:hypothetical protein